MRQLLLGHGVEHIALIFLPVQRFFQHIARRCALYTGVMSRSQILAAQHLRPLQKAVEFHVAVAVNTGIGRQSVFVGTDKFIHDLIPKLLSELKHIVRHPQPDGHGSGVLHVVQRTTGTLLRQSCILVAVQLHGAAHAVIALILQQLGGHTGIHAAAHGHQHLHAPASPSMASSSGSTGSNLTPYQWDGSSVVRSMQRKVKSAAILAAS